jgi:putative membrane protein
MIDYVTLMLINMTAALVLIGVFILIALAKEDNKNWSVPFMMSGLIGTITGFAMTFTWPLPSPYNIAFGEASVLLGILLLGTGVAIAKGWDLFPVCIYAVFAGLVAILIGIRFIDLGLSKAPLLSGAGFILTGICGVCSGLVVKFKQNICLRLCGSIVLWAAAGIWFMTSCAAYWGHLLVQ